MLGPGRHDRDSRRRRTLVRRLLVQRSLFVVTNLFARKAARIIPRSFYRTPHLEKRIETNRAPGSAFKPPAAGDRRNHTPAHVFDRSVIH
jgi:hypothetical protein